MESVAISKIYKLYVQFSKIICGFSQIKFRGRGAFLMQIRRVARNNARVFQKLLESLINTMSALGTF
jgi:hypothetical protein